MIGIGKHRIHPDDPLILQRAIWPQYHFHDKQVEMVRSTFRDAETYVKSANMMGKDFGAGFCIAAAFVLCLIKNLTCRIVTTSVSGEHLGVLWAEVAGFMSTAKEPLLAEKGGPFVMLHQELRRKEEAKESGKNVKNYAIGMVYEKPEKLQGHHAQWTLFVGDESSGLENEAYEAAQGWAKHMLLFGNPRPCQNFWRQNIEGGDVPIVPGGKLVRA